MIIHVGETPGYIYIYIYKSPLLLSLLQLNRQHRRTMPSTSRFVRSGSRFCCIDQRSRRSGFDLPGDDSQGLSQVVGYNSGAEKTVCKTVLCEGGAWLSCGKRCQLQKEVFKSLGPIWSSYGRYSELYTCIAAYLKVNGAQRTLDTITGIDRSIDM